MMGRGRGAYSPQPTMPPPTSITLTKDQHLAFILECQGLGKRPRRPGKADISALIDRLGYLQIDTIQAVRRSQYLVLWSRLGSYDVELLHQLAYKDRALFEGYSHMLSYIPMAHFPLFWIRHLEYRKKPHPWMERMVKELKGLERDVLCQIRERGAHTSRGFSGLPDIPDKYKGVTWAWRPLRVALEHLWNRGELLISDRDNFTRVYDLTERVLPFPPPESAPSEEERKRYIARTTLKAWGLITERDLAQYVLPRALYVKLSNSRIREELLREMIDRGEVGTAQMEGMEETFYYLTDLKPQLDAVLRRRKPLPDFLTLLSPFDNLICDRRRTKRVFGVDYVLEAYKPPKQRLRGYFAMPILWRGRLVGYIDPRLERKRGVIRVDNAELEGGFKGDDAFYSHLAKILRDFLAFHGVERIEVGRAKPPSLKRWLSEFKDKM